MAVALPDHDRLLQRCARRELGIKYGVHFLQGPASRLHAKDIPNGAVYDVEADKDEVVPPIDGIEGDGRHVRVIKVRAVGQDNVLHQGQLGMLSRGCDSMTYYTHSLGSSWVGQHLGTVRCGEWRVNEGVCASEEEDLKVVIY